MAPAPRLTPATSRDGSADLIAISPWIRFGFDVIARGRVRKAFRALRGAHLERAAEVAAEPLVVYLNHPSWWDPLLGFVLAGHLFAGRNFYAPMDAEALRRYRIFRRLGMFPVEMESARGAAQFLQSGEAVLQAGHILAVTPQGHFSDVRERPVHLRPGLAALLHRRTKQGKSTAVLPLALEYTFWDQRLPEALAYCGEPMRFSPRAEEHKEETRSAIQVSLEDALGRAQDDLAVLALRRNPDDFTAVLEGEVGSAGFYGLLERLRGGSHGYGKTGDHRTGSRS